MADKKQKSGSSRRAQRRQQLEQEAESQSVAGEPDSGGEFGDAPEGEEQSVADDGAKQAAARGAADRRGGRRKRRKSKGVQPEDEAESGAERIRDRNRRMRQQAADRRATRKERQTAVAQGLDTSELVDDALARSTHAAVQWIRRHFNMLQWVVVLGVAGGIGWQIYAWRSDRVRERASDQLMKAVLAQTARVGAGEPTPGRAEDLDTRLEFASHDGRLGKAAEAYQKSAGGSSEAAHTVLGELGLAGVYFDQGKYDEALAAYRAVRSSKLAASDADVLGRSLEGVGLCLVAKQDVEGALEAFRELENTETAGFVSLAQYHQARLLYGKGEKDKALELVKKVREKLAKDRSAEQAPGYLELAAKELHATIDPAAAIAMPASQQYTTEDLAKLRDDLQKLQERLTAEKGKLSAEDLEKTVEDPAALQRLLTQMGKLPGKLAQSTDKPPAPPPAKSAPAPAKPAPAKPAKPAPAPPPITSAAPNAQ